MSIVNFAYSGIANLKNHFISIFNSNLTVRIIVVATLALGCLALLFRRQISSLWKRDKESIHHKPVEPTPPVPQTSSGSTSPRLSPSPHEMVSGLPDAIVSPAHPLDSTASGLAVNEPLPDSPAPSRPISPKIKPVSPTIVTNKDEATALDLETEAKKAEQDALAVQVQEEVTKKAEAEKAEQQSLAVKAQEEITKKAEEAAAEKARMEAAELTRLKAAADRKTNHVFNIILIGRSRSGKSTLLNMLKMICQLASASGIFYATRLPALSEFTLFGYTFRVLDTPGLFEKVDMDSGIIKRDNETLASIIKAKAAEVFGGEGFENLDFAIFTDTGCSVGVNTDEINTMQFFLGDKEGGKPALPLHVKRLIVETHAENLEAEIDDTRNQIASHPDYTPFIDKDFGGKDKILFSGAISESDYNPEHFSESKAKSRLDFIFTMRENLIEALLDESLSDEQKTISKAQRREEYLKEVEPFLQSIKTGTFYLEKILLGINGLIEASYPEALHAELKTKSKEQLRLALDQFYTEISGFFVPRMLLRGEQLVKALLPVAQTEIDSLIDELVRDDAQEDELRKELQAEFRLKLEQFQYGSGDSTGDSNRISIREDLLKALCSVNLTKFFRGDLGELKVDLAQFIKVELTSKEKKSIASQLKRGELTDEQAADLYKQTLEAKREELKKLPDEQKVAKLIEQKFALKLSEKIDQFSGDICKTESDDEEEPKQLAPSENLLKHFEKIPSGKHHLQKIFDVMDTLVDQLARIRCPSDLSYEGINAISCQEKEEFRKTAILEKFEGELLRFFQNIGTEK